MTKFKVDPFRVYWDTNGIPTRRMTVTTMQKIEDYVYDRAAYATAPTRPGQRNWTRQDIERNFDAWRYCWGHTVTIAISNIVRDCRKQDADYYDDRG